MNVTEKELVNSAKVADLLSQIDGIGFVQQEQRPDLFTVSEEDTGLDAIIDVEDDIVIAFIDVTKLPEGGIPSALAIDLLKANDRAVHGAFTVTENGHLLFKSNLEVENLDLNELDAALRSIFISVYANLNTISTALKGA